MNCEVKEKIRLHKQSRPLNRGHKEFYIGIKVKIKREEEFEDSKRDMDNPKKIGKEDRRLEGRVVKKEMNSSEKFFQNR